MISLTDFRTALEEESDFPLNDNIFRYIIENSGVRTFARSEAIVDFGEINQDIYIIKEGIVRGYMLNEGAETNLYFGMEGTLVTSMQSFSNGSPAIIRFECCCPTTILHIQKHTFDRMMAESSEFCRWVAGVFTRRCCYGELKDKVMSGDAKWRYEWLERCRPELFENVPLKAIASYLKMTEVHVSRIRKKILQEKKINHSH